MPVVVPVKFPFASRDLWFDPEGLDIVQADYAVCDTSAAPRSALSRRIRSRFPPLRWQPL